MIRPVLLLTACLSLGACSSLPSMPSIPTPWSNASPTPPVPEDATDPASIVAAARACDVADYADWPEADVGRPEFSEGVSERDRNAMLSELYLERVAARPCVYALPSGLHFQVNRAVEEGPSPEPGQFIRAHYDGTLPNGDRFDSSYQRGTAMCAPSNVFIPGWNEALTLMRVGEEWELYIPASLAYGDRGAGGVIPPAMALKFRMELLETPESC